ncbi:MAG: tRNA-dihydrouridine synthase family protein [Promethearchaeia archaeon]
MRIETLELKNNLFLAPLQNVTTAPYRRFCRYYSEIGMVSVPMLYMLRVANSPNSVKPELIKIEEERPISIQLIGNKKQALIDSIDFLESYRYDMLDINAGCPSRRAITSKRGGYLTGNLKELKKIIKTAVKYSAKPVSVKIRIGLNEVVDVKKLSTILNDSGISLVIVHARTVQDRFSKEALNLSFVKHLTEKVNIPVIGNGDIWDGKNAKHFLNFTGVDGLMIGRASKGDPDVFNRIETYLKNEEKVPHKNSMRILREKVKTYERIIDEFLQDTDLISEKPDFKYHELFRNAIWLTKNLPDSTQLRREISQCRTITEIKQLLNI